MVVDVWLGTGLARRRTERRDWRVGCERRGFASRNVVMSNRHRGRMIRVPHVGLCREGGFELRDEGIELREEGDELREEGVELREEGVELREEGLELREEEVGWERRPLGCYRGELS